MYNSDSLACNNHQYQMLNTSSNLLDLNENSNSQSNNDAMFRNNNKKKPIRDPFAHRRVEKTRRDRMNFSLNRLCSLIPESFRNQVNQGNTRVDKIKIVDIAILYVEHLHEIIGQYSNLEEANKKQNENKQTNKKDAQTDTSDLCPSVPTSELDLSYIKGFFNGTLEYLSYLIEFNVLNKINKPTNQQNQAQKSDELGVLFNIELYINILRKFHSIYFNKIKLTAEQIKCVIESNINSKDIDSKRSLSFPFNNKKLIKKVLYILSTYTDTKQINFLKYYKKIYEYVLDYNICNDKFNLPVSREQENGCSSPELSLSPSSSRSSSVSPSRSSSDSFDTSENESNRKKTKNKNTSPPLANLSSQCVSEPKPQCSSPQKQIAKKLKSNLIERFSSSNANDIEIQEIQEIPAQAQPVVENEKVKKNNQSNEPDDEMLSIFILHSSHDFYLSGCLEKSLVDENLLKNLIKNTDFKPKTVQKIKLDVVFGADIVIKANRNTHVNTSQYSSFISNKRKIKELSPKLGFDRFNYNLTEENRILESYLKSIRKAHENKKKQLNGSKYDNLTILYKNYSRSTNLDNFSSTNDDDKMSERTFYSI